MITPVTIANDHWRVGLLPDTGGCVAFGQVRVDGDWVDVLRPTPHERYGERWDTASFPLVPWSNRVRHGTLLHQGEAHQLRRWGTEDFAMHGTGVEFPWQPTAVTEHSAELTFDARGYYGVNFPWDFVARFTYTLDGPHFRWGMSITNVDDAAFPAGLGHHPYFVRRLASNAGEPIGDEALLQVNAERAFGLNNGMADAAPGEIVANDDYRSIRGLGQSFVDACLTGRTNPIAARIEFPGAVSIDVEADALLEQVVVYVPVGEGFFAVEPVTNANDGFTLAARGIAGHGIFIVEPGATTATEFSLNVT